MLVHQVPTLSIDQTPDVHLKTYFVYDKVHPRTSHEGSEGE